MFCREKGRRGVSFIGWRGILSAGHTVPLWRFRILLSFDELLVLRLSRHPIPLAVCLSKLQLCHILVTRWYHMIENGHYLLLDSGRLSIIWQQTILLHPVTFWSPRKNTTRCGFLSLQTPLTTAPTMEIHLIQIPWCHRHVKTTQVLIVFGVAAWYVEVDPIFRKTPASSDELILLFSTSTWISSQW